MATYNFGVKSKNLIDNLAAGQNVTHTVTNSADMSTAADVSAAPTSGEKLVCLAVILSAGANINVTLKEETSGTVLGGPYYLIANRVFTIGVGVRLFKVPTADKKIQAEASGAGNITVETWTYSEP